jgi:hypothetical protein
VNYSKLFGGRTTDFVVNDGVRYFKWDGIQFSCSDPSHGHPVGIFSRRAVLESLIDKCNAVRAANPGMFLNITSGTWLSPWWVQYANTIWMQGADYGYADVPSFNKRDAGMTYRDMVLYDDFRRQGYWFPIANLMTHGTIKANLEGFGSTAEPLEKFTDDMLLYLARGVSMCELYISPDMLTEGEWKAIGESILWARDRFPILSHTEMIGGDPGKREPYGYVHWKGNRGIIAVRNPWVDRSVVKVRFDAADGLDVGATKLVLERVYPTKWISPKLHRAGESPELPLEGFETAIYEVYPLEDATRPLFAGVRFDERNLEDGRYAVTVFEGKPVFLNPQAAAGITIEGKETSDIMKGVPPPSRPLASSEVMATDGGVRIRVDIDPAVRSATVAVLVRPETGVVGKPLPAFAIRLDGRPTTASREDRKGAWEWYLTSVQGGTHTLELNLPDTAHWRGSVSAWLLSSQEVKGEEIVCAAAKPVKLPPMPPRPWPASEVRRSLPIGECVVERR